MDGVWLKKFPERECQLEANGQDDKGHKHDGDTHLRVIRVDQFGDAAASDAVIVDLGAGAARAGVPHLPEVVLAVGGESSQKSTHPLPNGNAQSHRSFGGA